MVNVIVVPAILAAPVTNLFRSSLPSGYYRSRVTICTICPPPCAVCLDDCRALLWVALSPFVGPLLGPLRISCPVRLVIAALYITLRSAIFRLLCLPSRIKLYPLVLVFFPSQHARPIALSRLTIPPQHCLPVGLVIGLAGLSCSYRVGVIPMRVSRSTAIPASRLQPIRSPLVRAKRRGLLDFPATAADFHPVRTPLPRIAAIGECTRPVLGSFLVLTLKSAGHALIIPNASQSYVPPLAWLSGEIPVQPLSDCVCL